MLLMTQKVENDFKALKRAYEDGYTIQAWRPQEQRWVDLRRPLWGEKTQYRVKPGALGLMSEQAAQLERKTSPFLVHALFFVAGVAVGGLLSWALR